MNTQLTSILIQNRIAEHASLRRAAERTRLCDERRASLGCARAIAIRSFVRARDCPSSRPLCARSATSRERRSLAPLPETRSTS